MLRLSVNLLSNVLSYLKEIQSTDKYLLREPVAFYHSYSVSIDSLLELSKRCLWIETQDNNATITKRGTQIIDLPGYGLTEERMCLMLHDYILEIHPIWANRIPYGRKEAYIFMSKDEKACFLEAGLMSDEISQNLVKWWDILATELRKLAVENKNSIGRRGEELTIQYEYDRTGVKPYWISIDSNLAGYDFTSQISINNNNRLLIEVKASTMPIELADFFLTQNEWKVASCNENYRFYLWNLSETTMLAVLRPNELSTYIPINQSGGQWETVRIPFSAFKDSFVVINP